MSVTASKSYAPCQACGALNMAHRRDCYRCHASLGTVAPPASAGHSLAGDDCSAQNEPPKVSPANVRRYPRDDVALHSVSVEGDGFPEHDAVVRNVSASGIGILTAVPCPEGASVRLRIALDGVTYRVDGVVQHTSSSRDGLRTLCLVGIKFIGDIPPLSRLSRRR